ncbi:MAG: HAMP domain-containing histidine kinase [[Lactobacillus] timonensis]|nr:HAMP domain-containing histidine kinase [[Lactobacillus] timonensis]
MKLTAREKTSLFFEAVVTIVLFSLIGFALVVMIQQVVKTNPGLASGIYLIKRSLAIGPWHLQIWSYQRWLIAALAIIGIIVLWWRLIRRYHQYQLRHIINELHYISNGHLAHRIPFKMNGDRQKMIESVNALVDSAMQSMSDEKKVEQSKDELITNVSHDLRTPLTSIIGYLGLVEDGQYQNEDDLVKYAHIAYEKAKQMKTLVEDLFEYTKVQQDGAPVNMMRLDLGQLLEQVAASFELEGEKKGLKISSIVIPSPLKIEADPEQIGRAVSNLVANALKYGHGATYIHLSAREHGAMVQLTVANDGEAIPQQSIEHLFERFYRVEGSRSKKTGGTGLGLAIVKSIVDLHHGQISAHSDSHETSFIMTLPVKQAAQQETKPIQHH